MVILLFGPPGCGKGTQAPAISRQWKIPAISTGEMLRAEVAANTPLGQHAAVVLAAGKLIGDDTVNDMLVQRISRPDSEKGFLLDGYPRTVAQATFLDQLLLRLGFLRPLILHLSTPKSVIIERISNRRQCPTCGRIYNLLFLPPARPGVCDDDGSRLIRRKDDTPEIVENRFVEYEDQTKPVIDHYKDGCYHLINANRPSSEVFRDIQTFIEDYSDFCARNAVPPRIKKAH